MPTKNQKKRQFEVRSPDRETRTTRVVEEVSLEAAAIAFLEDFGDTIHSPEEHHVTVYVRDLAIGSEHCMSIDLDTGKAEPCK
jgi:hypothetical protein